MWVLPECVFVYHAADPLVLEWRMVVSTLWVPSSNQDPLEEQPVLSTAEPPLQLQSWAFRLLYLNFCIFNLVGEGIWIKQWILSRNGEMVRHSLTTIYFLSVLVSACGLSPAPLIFGTLHFILFLKIKFFCQCMPVASHTAAVRCRNIWSRDCKLISDAKYKRENSLCEKHDQWKIHASFLGEEMTLGKTKKKKKTHNRLQG